MGWGSAVHIFDNLVKSTKEAIEFAKDNYSDHIDSHELLVKIVEPLARELEEGDWDTQRDSDYYEELKYDVFPELVERDEEDRLDEEAWLRERGLL